MSLYIPPAQRQNLCLLLGVLGCPLVPIPICNNPLSTLHIKNIPLETSTAYYIIQQYLAAASCLKQRRCAKNMYASGMVKLIRCEMEISTRKNVRTMGSRTGKNGPRCDRSSWPSPETSVTILNGLILNQGHPSSSSFVHENCCEKINFWIEKYFKISDSNVVFLKHNHELRVQLAILEAAKKGNERQIVV
ncbi:uncharacterized protein LOC130998403 [Salvia miltiorrhiza]|uniref:uncharacterized protein LOC130998403 n=1 Tax=Salvia miltiorrhiza TaxID=226208 RepID=UPI0025ACE16A|nr:uncharacterized protein LOC130998403 [Salvia miltiorrhiza]